MRQGPVDRSAHLGRVSRLTRWLVAGAVALAGALTAVVALARPGASSSRGASGGGTSAGTAEPSAGQPSTGGGSGFVSAPPPQPTPHRGVARSGAS